MPTTASEPSFFDLTLPELAGRIQEMDEPAYRARQLYRWAYRRFAISYDAMTDIPASLRDRLARDLPLRSLRHVAQKESEDGTTRKALFRLRDGHTIETVLMLYLPKKGGSWRRTVCLSTQVGCPLGCAFCATGQMGLARDLTAGEIVEQVIAFARELRAQGMAKEEQPITNVVFMGMGEPFANSNAVWKAVHILHDPEGYNLGARNITVSTAGVVPGIRRLIEEKLQVNLAVSLHAPNDEVRTRIMPINRRYPLEQLLDACRAYVQATHRRITFEYVMIQGLNDSPEHAQEVGRKLYGMLCHVNLLPMNPIPGSDLRGSSPERIRAFQRELRKWGIPCTVRFEKGVDIQAGCGQLKTQVEAGRQKTRVPQP
ncbi:MAG: 23S rRNA (adenine(2503)-C(2))-methyltransferase RlmN [Chloroflexi bacterium]|nr:23S rRNA (adenine(2503)-C(2))-methyltransferase RlmN [Chloroflexota bacterium]